jgi:uncharacterized protein YfaS (alpha-2-macroglobulin family)
MNKKHIIFFSIIIFIIVGFLLLKGKLFVKSGGEIEKIVKTTTKIIDIESKAEDKIKIRFSLLKNPSEGQVPVYIDFSTPVNKKIKDRTLITRNFPLKLYPPIRGSIFWENSSRLAFYPEERYKPATTYRVALSGSLTDKVKLKETKNFFFTTEDFKVLEPSVVSINYYNKSVKIEIPFNYSVDSENLKESLKITDYETGKEFPFEISSNEESKLFYIKITNLPDYIIKAKYPVILKISSKLTVKNNKLSLGKTFVKSLKLVEPGYFKLVKYEFKERNQKFSLILRFSSEIKENDFSSFFNLSPLIKYSIRKVGKLAIISADFKPGEKFNITVKKGLKSTDNKEIGKDEKFFVKVPDFSEQLNFLYKGRYLPKGDNPVIKIKSVNIKTAKIIIRKIYPNNLAFWYAKYYKNRWEDEREADEFVSSEIFKKYIILGRKKNKEIITTIGLKEFTGKKQKGVFEIRIFPTYDSYKSDTIWVNLTNIGLIYKRGKNAIKVWALDLKTHDFISGVKVSLLTINNQIRSSAYTGGDGSVEFTNIENLKSTGKLLLITAEKGDDFTYLDTDYSKIDVSDYDTGGAPYKTDSGYQAFIYSERDIFRPGEKANIAVIIRDSSLKPVGNLMFTLKIFRPDGKLKKILKGKPNANGMMEWKIDFSDYDKTGTYPIRCFLGGRQIGNYYIKLEDFIPERVKLKTEINKKEFQLNETPEIKLKANYLFGPPVKEGKFKITSYIVPIVTSFKGYSEYIFGTELSDFKQIKIYEEDGKLDENGEKLVNIMIPSGKYSGKMKISVDSEVFEGDSGKSVLKKVSAIYSPFKEYIGIKVPVGYLSGGEKTEIEGVLVNSSGKLIKDNKKLVFEIYKRDYSWVYYYDREQWRSRYKRVSYEELIDNGNINCSNGKFKLSFTPDWGTYRIRVKDNDGDAITDTIVSTYWWDIGGVEKRSRPPERMNIFLDKKIAEIGDKIKVGFTAPFDGKLLISVEGDELLYTKWKNIKRGKQDIKIKIGKNMYLPNVYISLLIIKKTDNNDPFPSRAFGITPLKIVPNKNLLKIDIKTPEKIKPGKNLLIKVKADSNKPVDITIAAVDEGILQITDFSTPDPIGFFFRKRRLETWTYDMFGMLLPDLSDYQRNGAGYGEEAAAKKRKPPVVRRVKPVSLWSGIIELNNRGEGEVKFKIPNYQGRLRVMVVAASDKKFGNSEKTVFIKDNITIEATLPRVLIKGDKFNVPVEIFNNNKTSKYVKLELKNSNLKLESSLPPKVLIKKNGSEKINLVFSVKDTNKKFAVFKLIASDDSTKVFKKIDIPLKNSMPLESEVFSYKIDKGEFTVPVSLDKWKEGANLNLSISNFEYIKELGFVINLIKYPYGCIEQTVSSVFPLLYLKDIMDIIEPGLLKKKNIYKYVEAGINRVLSMQTVSGGFTFWPGGSYEVAWGSTYAMHFLYEAKQNGYDVPDFVLRNGVDYLKDAIRYKKPAINANNYYIYKFNRSAYTIYVLTKLGKYTLRELDSYYDNYYKYMSPEGKALIGGAYINLGNYERGEKIIKENSGKDSMSSYYGSSLRSYAVRLYLTAETNSPEKFSYAKQVATILKERPSYYYTTQELVWSVLGLGKILRKEKLSDINAEIKVNDKTIKKIGKTGGFYNIENYSGENIKIINKGEPVYLFLTISGRKKESYYKNISNGFNIERKYYTMEGTPIPAEGGIYSTNVASLIVVKLTITSYMGRLDNIAIVDRIPAGFEIENPRIGREHPINWLGKPTFIPEYTDIRDDRLMIFGNYNKKQGFFYYIIRAVSKGDFVLPPVHGELMYSPEKRSLNNKGRFIVK